LPKPTIAAAVIALSMGLGLSQSTMAAASYCEELKQVAGHALYAGRFACLEHTWSEPISGRVGLWSKADSYVFFDDYTVTPIN